MMQLEKVSKKREYINNSLIKLKKNGLLNSQNFKAVILILLCQILL